jgi:hypothetical protein
MNATADERREALNASIATWGLQGWRVESRSDTQATLAKGRRPNHLLHLILTLVTFGLWALVWIGVAIASKERRQVLTVNGEGVVTATGS